jgi:hypothetical protein
VKDRVEWVVVATFSHVYEAEIAKAILESSGIPAQVLGEHIGVFGPGWSGMAIRGVRLVVPSTMIEDANEVLSEDAYFEDAEDDEEDEDDEDAEDEEEAEDEDGEEAEPVRNEEPWRTWGEWGPGAN